MAGLGAAALDGPLAFPRGETVLVASSFEQARISFEHILAFMGDKLDNRDRWRVWDMRSKHGSRTASAAYVFAVSEAIQDGRTGSRRF